MERENLTEKQVKVSRQYKFMNKTIKILLAEDNMIDAMFLQKQLSESKENFVTTHCTHLKKALELLKTEIFDVILLDLGLPDSYGADTFRRLYNEVKSVPVIVLSGIDDEDLAVNLVREGAQDYLIKGHIPTDLIPKIILYAIERKQSEMQLKQERDRLKEFLDITGTLILVLDTQMNVTLINKKGCELLGYKENEIIGSNWYDRFLTSSVKDEIKILYNQLMTGELEPPEFYENPVLTKTGEINILLHARILKDNNGKITGTLTSGEDITDRKLNEKKIIRLNRLYSVLSNINEAIVRILDPQVLFEEVCRILVENGNFLMAWIGIIEQDSIKVAAKYGFHDGFIDTMECINDINAIFCPVTSSIQEQKINIFNDIKNSNYRFPCRDEALKRGYNSFMTIPIKKKTHVTAIMAIYSNEINCFDNEEIQLIEQLSEDISYALEKIEQTAVLETTNQKIIQQTRLHALGEMASGVAHDLNNLLTPILGFSELLMMKPDILDNKEKLIKYIDMIHRSAKDSQGVIKRLREFYRKRDKNEELEIININNLIDHALELTRPKWEDQMQGENININLVTDLKNIPQIYGNETELKEVLTNLIFNAVEAMPDGGRVNIATATSDGNIVITLSDTGKGMSPDVLTRCFEPFFSTKGKKGCGLGLSIVYGIIQRHEGIIEVTSEKDKGTIFIIKLPVKNVNLTINKKINEKIINASLNILVAEDKDMVRNTICEYLLSYGHKTVSAINGLDALGKFKSKKFDLVITDRAMPEMSGSQLAREIKKISPNTPVIMLTGFTGMMDDDSLIMNNIDLILAKPITIDKLNNSINNVMKKIQ